MDTSINILDIPYCPEITMLGFRFTRTVGRSGNVTWSRVTGKVEALARDLYGRDHWGDLGVDGWIILGWISRRWDVGIWTGLGWHRIGTSGVRL